MQVDSQERGDAMLTSSSAVAQMKRRPCDRSTGESAVHVAVQRKRQSEQSARMRDAEQRSESECEDGQQPPHATASSPTQQQQAEVAAVMMSAAVVPMALHWRGDAEAAALDGAHTGAAMLAQRRCCRCHDCAQRQGGSDCCSCSLAHKATASRRCGGVWEDRKRKRDK